jgi:uncharacterized coiled-coil protein SlyX
MTASLLPHLAEQIELYLEGCVAAWLNQPENARCPTLPVTTDGKVNVRAVAEASGVGAAREQHLFKRQELRAAINAVAIEQGVKPIGSRQPSEDLEKEVAARLRRTDMRSSELSKLVAEQASTIERQRRTIEALREQLGAFEETGQIVRTGEVRS